MVTRGLNTNDNQGFYLSMCAPGAGQRLELSANPSYLRGEAEVGGSQVFRAWTTWLVQDRVWTAQLQG